MSTWGDVPGLSRMIAIALLEERAAEARLGLLRKRFTEGHAEPVIGKESSMQGNAQNGRPGLAVAETPKESILATIDQLHNQVGELSEVINLLTENLGPVLGPSFLNRSLAGAQTPLHPTAPVVQRPLLVDRLEVIVSQVASLRIDLQDVRNRLAL